MLGLAGYLEAGGVAGALTRSAEAVYAALDDDGRSVARRLLVRLADVDERIRARVDMQLDGGTLPGTPSTVLDLAQYEETGDYGVLREGAVPAVEIAALL